MHLNWIETKNLSFNNLLLLEQVQISWLPGWVPKKALALALRANPVVEWYLRHKCPESTAWLDKVCAIEIPEATTKEVYAAEQEVLQTINDLLVYAIDPTIYDTKAFLDWENRELLEILDFNGKIILDIGSGTGRLAFTVAPAAQAVFCVEPVGNLRQYIKNKSKRYKLNNIYPVDGTITDIPFPDGFADVTMSGFVFGTSPEAENKELERVTKPGGTVILYPGNVDKDNPVHDFLVTHNFQW